MHRAKELLFLGDDVSAADAERIGIANRVVAAADLDAEVDALARRFTTLPTKALALTKRMLNRTFETSREQSFEDEAFFQEMIVGTGDTQEGLAAFRERRQPEFRGW
jgi:2-(1,2-epoxy-1,2-dihydrophenyl)acetyl-CoA isomerase